MAPFRKLLVRNTHFKIKTMAKFRKKPVVIDAVQWTGVNHLITSTFMAGSGATLDYTESALGDVIIPTLESEMRATAGDYIIKGVKGEFYPCKEDIFLMTYDEVKDDGPGVGFGEALKAVKAGRRAARVIWHGHNTACIFLRPADTLTVDFILNKVKSLPDTIKAYFSGRFAWTESEEATGTGPKDTTVGFTPYLCMLKGGTINNGWAPTQEDMLADDWVILD